MYYDLIMSLIHIKDVHIQCDFSELIDISSLAQKMIDNGLSVFYYLVYLLVKLALILLIATVTIKRVFSLTKLIKTSLKSNEIYIDER